MDLPGRRFRLASCFVAALVVCLALPLAAQQISGSISGLVKDAQGASVANAKVTVFSVAQGTTREQTTGPDGSFVITPLQPGRYNLTVEATGFKKIDQRDITLNASDRISLGDLTLAIGALSESVTVEASAVLLQTSSADRSGLLSTKQVTDLGMVSRSYYDLARTVPGIVYTGGLGGIQANGNRGNQNNLTLDGVTNVDTGSNGGDLATTNTDMIAEFKIITNSQPAEYGRSSGAQILVVTKSGTQDFHGTGYWFHRHEGLNANRWINNINNVPRPFYRYNFAGFNVGGPVYIPGKFNKDKNKLFFFMGIEWQNQLVPNPVTNVTVPTALERTGNFSQSITGGGTPVVILDPLNNRQPFPNMTIPANRINSDGQKILNWYPLPNALNQSSQYNYQTQVSDTYPRKEYIYRGDYNINEKWRAYARYVTTSSVTNKNYGQWNADYNIPFSQMNFGNPGWSFIANVTTVINPTLTNEFIFGSSKNVLNIDPVDDTFSRSKLNLSYTMPFPKADTLGLVQNWRWGGVPNSPFTGFNGTPFRNFNHTYDITDNVAKVIGTHTFKAGIYIQKSDKDQTAFTSVNGDIQFQSDTSNPNDTNWAWANGLTGTFQTLSQSNQVLNGQYRYWNVEWFVQDNWRVNSKFTLDYGIRFYWMQPQYDAAYQTSAFNPALYQNASAGVLRQPALQNGNRVSYNPVSGEYGPAALIGSLVNNGKGYTDGLYANGMGRSNKDGYPPGLINGSGILFGPRLGASYRINDKTVIRGGTGIFYDRFQGNPVFDMLPNPPSTNRPTFYYGNLSAIPPASAGIYFPASVIGFDKNGQIPTTYNWNVTVQRQLPWNVSLDVAYVGSVANHIIYRLNQNTVPLGSAWLPQNQDPLNASPKYDGTTTQPVNFYRPYMGYADANTVNFGANSNYNSLQVSAQRRFGNNVTFGVAYTWSKALGTTTDDGTYNNFFNTRAADYGPLFYDRTHLLVFNYLWTLPQFVKGDSGGAKFLKQIVNDWQLSGITTMSTGQPNNISFGINNFSNLNERYTGSVNTAPRVVFNGPTSYPKTDYQWMTTDMLALPVLKGSQGFDSAPRNIRSPGDNNWDLSVFKNFRYMKREGNLLQLRLEMFNAPNHTRFSDFNRSVQFDALGKITNLPNALGGTGGRFGFGALNATRDPRIIQLAVKIYF
jgi:hypothetical protein